MDVIVLISVVTLLGLIECINTENCHTCNNERLKRQVNGIPLIYPYGATYKLLIGFSSPVKMDNGISLLFAANFQYQYLQFTNVSQLSQYYFVKEVSREERDVNIKIKRDERLTFYKSFADLLKTRGVNGKECVLRAICEAAQYPVEKEGLVGEIMHILLTPDYGRTPFDNEDPKYLESIAPYRNAAVAGRQMFSCPSVYSGCPQGQGVMELISLLRDK